MFTGIALGLAVFASIAQQMHKIDCPKTSSGIPKCYLSLLLLSLIITFKIITILRAKIK